MEKFEIEVYGKAGKIKTTGVNHKDVEKALNTYFFNALTDETAPNALEGEITINIKYPK